MVLSWYPIAIGNKMFFTVTDSRRRECLFAVVQFADDGEIERGLSALRASHSNTPATFSEAVTRGSGTGPTCTEVPAQTIDPAIRLVPLSSPTNTGTRPLNGCPPGRRRSPDLSPWAGPPVRSPSFLRSLERAATGKGAVATNSRHASRAGAPDGNGAPDYGPCLPTSPRRDARKTRELRRMRLAPGHGHQPRAVAPATLETCCPRDRTRKRYEPAKLIERPAAHQGEGASRRRRAHEGELPAALAGTSTNSGSAAISTSVPSKSRNSA